MNNILKILIPSLLLTAASGCDAGSDEFSRARLNNGIEVDAPDGWRWARDGIQDKSMRILAGEPDRIDPASKALKNSLGSWEYITEIAGTKHRFFFNVDGFFVGCKWYENLQEDTSLDAPTVSFTEKLSIKFPRCVPMVWDGESENGFEVFAEIQIGEKWEQSANYFTKNNRAVHLHTGKNEGRWRVRKLSLKGYGPWSEYVEFKCTQ